MWTSISIIPECPVSFFRSLRFKDVAVRGDELTGFKSDLIVNVFSVNSILWSAVLVL